MTFGKTLLVRDALPADESAWRLLWSAFLDYYGVTLPEATIDFTWKRLMDPASPLKARLAATGTELVGFAIHQHHPSTWVMGDDCYLEDLFVTDSARGRCVGRALIEDLMTLARARGWKRLYWNTDHDNQAARKLYDSFIPSDGHVRYRLTL